MTSRDTCKKSQNPIFTKSYFVCSNDDTKGLKLLRTEMILRTEVKQWRHSGDILYWIWLAKRILGPLLKNQTTFPRHACFTENEKTIRVSTLKLVRINDLDFWKSCKSLIFWSCWTTMIFKKNRLQNAFLR